MTELTPELKQIASQLNMDVVNNTVWQKQIQQRKQHHMRGYLRMILIKMRTEDQLHAGSQMQTQSLLRNLMSKHGL